MGRQLMVVTLGVFLICSLVGCEISVKDGETSVKGSINDVKVNTKNGGANVQLKNVKITGSQDGKSDLNLGDVSVNADGKGARVKVGNSVNVNAGEEGVNVKAGSASVKIDNNGIDIKTGNKTADGILGSVLKNVPVSMGDDDDDE